MGLGLQDQPNIPEISTLTSFGTHEGGIMGPSEARLHSDVSAVAHETTAEVFPRSAHQLLSVAALASQVPITSPEWPQSALGTIKDCIRALSSPSPSPASTPAQSPAVRLSSARQQNQLLASAGLTSRAVAQGTAIAAASPACSSGAAVLSRTSYSLLQPISIAPFQSLTTAEAAIAPRPISFVPFSPSLFSEPAVCHAAGPDSFLPDHILHPASLSLGLPHDTVVRVPRDSSEVSTAQSASTTTASIALAFVQHLEDLAPQAGTLAADVVPVCLNQGTCSSGASNIPCTPNPEQPGFHLSATGVRSVHTQVTPQVVPILVSAASPSDLLVFTPAPPAVFTDFFELTPALPAIHTASDPFHLNPAQEPPSCASSVLQLTHSLSAASCVVDPAMFLNVNAAVSDAPLSLTQDSSSDVLPLSPTHDFVNEGTPVSTRDSVYDGIVTPQSCSLSPFLDSVYDGVTTPNSAASSARHSVYDGVSFDSPVTGLRSLGGHTPSHMAPSTPPPDSHSPSPATRTRYMSASRHASADLPHPRPLTTALEDFAHPHPQPAKVVCQLWSPSRCSLGSGNLLPQAGSHTHNSSQGSSPQSAGKSSSPHTQQQRVTLCVAAGDGHASRRVRTSQDLLLDMHGSPTAVKATSHDPHVSTFSQCTVLSGTTALAYEQRHDAAAGRSILSHLSNSIVSRTSDGMHPAAPAQHGSKHESTQDERQTRVAEGEHQSLATLSTFMSALPSIAADSQAAIAHVTPSTAEPHAISQAVGVCADLVIPQASERVAQTEPAPRLSQLLGLWGSRSFGSLKSGLAGRGATRVAMSQPVALQGVTSKRTTATAVSQSRAQSHAQASAAANKPRMWPVPAARSRIPRPPAHCPPQQLVVLATATNVQLAEVQPRQASASSHPKLYSGFSKLTAGDSAELGLTSSTQLEVAQGSFKMDVDLSSRSPCAVLQSSSNSQVTQTTPGSERGSERKGSVTQSPSHSSGAAAADGLGMSRTSPASFTFDLTRTMGATKVGVLH